MLQMCCTESLSPPLHKLAQPPHGLSVDAGEQVPVRTQHYVFVGVTETRRHQFQIL